MTTSGRDTPATRVNDTLPEGSGAAGVGRVAGFIAGRSGLPPARVRPRSAMTVFDAVLLTVWLTLIGLLMHEIAF